MSLEDSFLIVQNEVIDVLLRLRNQYTQWQDLNENTADVSREEYSALVLELKNGIKSIQWDLDELEESLDASDRQGKLDIGEIDKRRQFITKTREEVNAMNEKLAKTKVKTRAEFPLPNFGSQTFAQLNPTGTKYTKLTNAPDVGNGHGPSTSGPGENVLFSQNFSSADDDSKSPYANDYTISGFDDDNHHINVVSHHNSKLVALREWFHDRPRQFLVAVGSATLFVILFLVMII